jgi:hypothetical protein
MKEPRKLINVFHRSLLDTIGLLAVEFVLGMYTAFFVAFPDSLVDGNAWAWTFGQSPIVVIHIIIGTLLLIGSLVVLVLSFFTHEKAAIITAILGVVMTLAAYMGGSTFLANVNNDVPSFIMALGFLGAMIVYGAGYYLTRPVPST